jgi:nucleoside-diphosphate-sugar epimerase
MLGNLSPKRSYIHVRDTAEGLYHLINTKIDDKYDVFNIGTEIEHSVTDIINTISDILKRPLSPVSVPERTRKVDRLNQQASLTKIKLKSNWKPMRNLKDALADAIKDFGL